MTPREIHGNCPEAVPTTSVTDFWPHRDEIEVKHWPPSRTGNPFTTIRFGSTRNNISMFIRDPEAAKQIVAGLDEVIRGWPQPDEVPA